MLLAAATFGKTGGYKDSDVNSNMQTLTEKLGMPAAEVQQMMDEGLLPESVATATEGMNQAQANRFAKSMGVAQGMRAGVIEKRGDGYFAGNRKVAGEWKDPEFNHASNQVRHDPYLGIEKGLPSLTELAMRHTDDQVYMWSGYDVHTGEVNQFQRDAALTAINLMALPLLAVTAGKKSVDIAFNVTSNVGTYLSTTDPDNWSLKDGTVHGLIGVGEGITGMKISSGKFASRFLRSNTSKAGMESLVNIGGNIGSQMYSNGGNFSEINGSQVLWSGTTGASKSFLNSVSKNDSWIGNSTTLVPGISGSVMINEADKEFERQKKWQK